MNNNESISKEQMTTAMAEHEVFRDLDKKSLAQLEAIVHLKIVKKYDVLFEIGDLPNTILYLLSGSLTLHFPDRSKLMLDEGELIGEIGLLNGDFRLGRLVANTDCQLISLCGDGLFNPDVVSTNTSLSITRKLGKRVTNYLKSLQQTSTQEIIRAGENRQVEFKSTMRWNLKAGKKDKEITHAILKTIAAFLNSDGGTLIIGVEDNGNIIGVGEDRFDNSDKMLLFLTSIIKSNLGSLHMDSIYFHEEEIAGKTILRVDLKAGESPCYVSSGSKEHFYIRTGPATTELGISKLYTYVKKRFYE